MSRPKRKAVKRVPPVRRLLLAMDRCAIARAEANWTNGYRAAIAKTDGAEEARLYAKEMLQWKAVERVDRAFCRLAQRVLREARKAGAQ